MDRAFLCGLTEREFWVEQVCALRQTWKSSGAFTMAHPRPTNALLLFTKGAADCRYRDGRTIHVPEGALAAMGEGAEYTWLFHGEGATVTTLLFEFCLRTPSGQPLQPAAGVEVIDTGHTGRYAGCFEEVIAEYARPRRCPAAVLGAGYRLLADVARTLYWEGREETLRPDARPIAQGMRYLEEDARQEKSIAQVARMCGVSVNYFERLFRETTGMTPTEYRAESKLLRAGELLRKGNQTLEAIAEELGFNDAAYFCRFFRRHTGMTPTEYRRQKREW